MIPVVLLTGFLGSGKTTLLNWLMRSRPTSDRRFAVIVNEFGEVGIDGDLLPDANARQVELPGGCICCQLDEDLEKTIVELVRDATDLEAIIVETTGVAEPLPIVWTLDREPLCNLVRLAAVVTVVDGENHEKHRPLSPAVDNQTEYADVIVVSKNPPSAALADHFFQMNPNAPVISGALEERGKQLWNIIRDPSFETTERPAKGHVHGHDVFQSVALPIAETLDFEELAEQLEALPGSYTRIKGIARGVDPTRGQNEPRLMAFHRVGTRFSCEVVTGDPSPRVVAIGPRVDATELAACISAAVLP